MILSSVIQRTLLLYFILVFLDHVVPGMHIYYPPKNQLFEMLKRWTFLFSVNNIIAHGIPDEFVRSPFFLFFFLERAWFCFLTSYTYYSRPLEDGDIVNVDVAVFLNGYYGDTSQTFLVGNVVSVDLNDRSYIFLLRLLWWFFFSSFSERTNLAENLSK